MSFHEDGPTCAGCEKKLTQVHATLAAWFRTKKANYINLHISDGWRGPEDQEAAYLAGKSNAQFPHSKHNHMDSIGRPLSLAIDIFQIDQDGIARWSPPFYAKLNQENHDDRVPILWGGTFKLRSGARDNPHFELTI